MDILVQMILNFSLSWLDAELRANARHRAPWLTGVGGGSGG